MKRPRLRAYLGLGLLAAGLCGLALSGDLLAHLERFVAFYGLSLAGFALLATAAKTLPLRGALVAAVILRVIFLPGSPASRTTSTGTSGMVACSRPASVRIATRRTIRGSIVWSMPTGR